MRAINVREIAECLETSRLYADFTERACREPNREKYGIYDIRNSYYGPFMIRFNEAYNSGKLVHYIDLRIPSIEFSKLFFDCNIPMKIDTADSDYTALYKIIRHINIQPSGMSFNAALEKFKSLMTRPDISTSASQKYINARVIYDVINQMISMGPRNTKYSVLQYGFRVSVTFQDGATEIVNLQRLQSGNHETVKIEIPSIKLTEKFNNYEDRTNIMLFDHATRYMNAMIPREQLTQGMELFDRLDDGYCKLMRQIISARNTPISR